MESTPDLPSVAVVAAIVTLPWLLLDSLAAALTCLLLLGALLSHLARITLPEHPTVEPVPLNSRPALFSLKLFLATLLVKAGAKRRPPFSASAAERAQPVTLRNVALAHNRPAAELVFRPEEPRPTESQLQLYTDNFYFNARTMDGVVSVWTRFGFRPHGVEVWVYVHTRETGSLSLRRDLSPFSNSNDFTALSMKNPLHEPIFPLSECEINADGTEFSAGGLRMKCLEPMKKWIIQFDGRLSGVGVVVPIRFDLTYTAGCPPMLYDENGSVATTAYCLARNQWSREYFQKLRQLHQKHYEQGGVCTGSIQFKRSDTDAVYRPVSVVGPLFSTRDRTFGVRYWSHFHRWVFHTGAFEDGTFIGTIVVRRKLLNLYVGGFVCRKDSITPITDFTSFAALGEVMPKTYTCRFKLEGSDKEHTLRVDRNGNLVSAWEFGAQDAQNDPDQEPPSVILCEASVSFQLNGTRGIGIAEWGYRASAFRRPEMALLSSPSHENSGSSVGKSLGAVLEDD